MGWLSDMAQKLQNPNRKKMNEQKEGVDKHGNLSIAKRMSGETFQEQSDRADKQATERERRARENKGN